MPDRGRPQTTDPRDIAATALELFERQGFGATTMDQVAEVAGVSRTTLFRYFPRKADLLWARQADWVESFKMTLAAQPADVTEAEAVVAAMVTGFDAEGLTASTKDLVRVVTDPAAFHDAWLLYQRWGEIVVEFVAERRGVPTDDFAANVAGRTIWSAIWTAQVAWSETDDPRPDAFLRRAAALLDE